MCQFLTVICSYYYMSFPYLECVDEGKVVERDIIVVVLDITEGLLMVLHQGVDLTVLPLLDLMDLSLPPQVQLISQSSHLLLVLRLNLPCLALKVPPQFRDLLIIFLEEKTTTYLQNPVYFNIILKHF